MEDGLCQAILDQNTNVAMHLINTEEYDLEKPNWVGNRPIHCACTRADLVVFEELIRHKVDLY